MIDFIVGRPNRTVKSFAFVSSYGTKNMTRFVFLFKLT